MLNSWGSFYLCFESESHLFHKSEKIHKEELTTEGAKTGVICLALYKVH